MIEKLRYRRFIFVVGFFVLIISFFLVPIMPGTRVLNYVNHSPEFCKSCHVMQHAYDSWKESPHKDVNCKDCHKQNPYDRARIAYSALSQNLLGVEVKVGSHTQLDKAVCQACHYSNKDSIPQVAETAGHKKHIGYLNFQCVTCHFKSSEKLHVFTPLPEKCVTCHPSSAHNVGGMSGLECTACHAFLDKKNTDFLPTKIACLSCHQDLEIKDIVFPKDGGPMDFECKDCHKPHTKEFLSFSDCLSCHDSLFDDPKHTNLGQKGMTNCTTSNCHRPHDWITRSSKHLSRR